MANLSSSGAGEPPSRSSLSHERERRRKRGDRLVSILLLLTAVALAGASYWYASRIYLPEKRALESSAANQRLAAALSQSITTLTEWSSEKSFLDTRRALDALKQRDGVQPAELARLEAMYASPYAKRQERMGRYERLLGEVRSFPLDAGIEAMRVLDERVRREGGEFERELARNLRAAWRQRKREAFGLGEEDCPISEAYAGLELRTVPSQATVYLDGDLISQTPLAIDKLLPGRHTVELELEHHFSRLFEIDLRPGQRLKLADLEMLPILGSARIEIVGTKEEEKIGIDVLLPSKDMGLYDFSDYHEGRRRFFKELRIGEYQLTVYRDGGIAYEGNFEVREGETTELRIDLANVPDAER